jgi:hypothetical protein
VKIVLVNIKIIEIITLFGAFWHFPRFLHGLPHGSYRWAAVVRSVSMAICLSARMTGLGAHVLARA